MKPLLLLLAATAHAATIYPPQPDLALQLTGPVTTIDATIPDGLLAISRQYPQDLVLPNAQHTLIGYFSLTDPARLALWAPAAVAWEPPSGPITVTIPGPGPVPVPSVPEVGTWQVVSGALLVLSGYRWRRR